MLLKRSVLVAVLTAGLAALGYAQEVKRDPAPDEIPTHLIKVLRTTNKAQTNRYVPKVYTVDNVNPYSLFRWVNRAARIEEGTYHFFGKPEVEGDWDSVKSGKVVLVVPEYMLEGMDELMEILDREGLTSSAGEKVFYFRPQHRSVRDTGFTDIIRQLSLSTTGSSAKHADVEANMFMLYDAPSALADVKRLLPLFDVAPPQVTIEATVYEIDVDNESRIGLDYVAWKNGPGRHLFAFGAFGERTGGSGVFGLPGSALQGEGSNYALYLDVPSAFFDFLVVKGKARVLTAARLAARNLIPATLTVGDTILFYESAEGSASNAGLRPIGHPVDPLDSHSTFPDNRTVVGTSTRRILTGETVGVELQITPTIGTEEINLDIEVSLVSHTGFDDQGAPLLAERAIHSEVRVRDGQQIVLGGYGREVLVERSDKIPFLGSLPLIGSLFGSDATTTQRRQVVVVLTTHVIKDFSAMSAGSIDAALIRSRAMREEPVEVPQTQIGFDQWLLDSEK